MSTLTKVVRGVLYFQAAIFVFKSAAFWFGLPVPGVGVVDAMSRRASALDLGFAVVLVLAARRLPEDPSWIQPVLALVAANWLVSNYEIWVMGDRTLFPPLIVESILGALYVAYVISSSRKKTAPSAVRSSA